MAVTAIATAAPCLATRKTVVARKAINGVAGEGTHREEKTGIYGSMEMLFQFLLFLRAVL
jgi:hypothetical protein